MKNLRRIDKMAIEAMEFILDYCDMTDLCDDCVFHNSDEDCCQLRKPLSDFESFIKEVKSHATW